MQPLSRHFPAPLARNKKLDNALSLSLNDPSDPSLPTDTTVHIHRAPLAQIDQQNVAPTPAELSPLSRAPPEPIPPTRALGKPIMPRRSSYTGEDGLYTASTSSQSPPYRRLSQSRINPSAPYPSSKPTRRPAPNHTPPTVLTSTRRDSLPALHLHTPTQSTLTVSIAPSTMQENLEIFNDDDYYAHSSLATFSFGAATTHRQPFDSSSPLSVQAASESGHSHSTGSIDHTPRPSISNTRGPDDDGGEDETRRSRAKMRAIDDGGRRPSLPTNIYTPDRRGDDNLPSTSSRRHAEASESDSDAITSGNASDADFDRGGIVDTDVELEGMAPDDTSQNTFGFDQCEDWYVINPIERRQDTTSPVVFARAESEDDDSDVSETGSRGLAAMHRNSVAIRVASARERSLQPNEMGPGQIQMNAREREDSASTVRRPNNEDRDASVQITVTGPNRERRPSLPTPNWSMFNAPGISSTGDSGESVYQGIDLNYIMSVGGSMGPGSRRSSHSFVAPQSLPLPPPKDKSKSKDNDKRKKDKSKGKETLDITAMQGLIGPQSAIAPWAEPDQMIGPRRPSTVTLDDSFAGGLRRLDPGYAERRNEWSFVREREQAVLPPRDPEGSPRTWDVWRCAQIGKIRLERAILPPSDPDKPNQQRLNAEHDVDPDSTNNLGGPTTVIHRHSRALAFSIYRHYSLKNYRSGRDRPSMTGSTRTQRSGEGRNTLVMPAHDGILLATKRVQVQFTYTKSTSRLDTHGLLPEDSDNRRNNRHGPPSVPSQRVSQDSPGNSPTREAHGPRQIMDLSRLEELDNQPASLRRSRSTRTTTSSLDLSGSTAFGYSSPTSPPTSSSAASTLSERQLSPHDEADEDSDGEFPNPIPRTSHAEAFATLDSFAIDQIKNEQVPAPTTRRSHSNWIQRWIGPPSGSAARTLSSINPINPPWMTLVPRSMQEEQDRAIQGLRSSFKDVGLVPSSRPKGGAGIGRKGKGKNKDMLTQVPDDSLYMLLPLWPHETDPASAARERRQPPVKSLDREQNLYLLVYYVPFDKRGEGNTVKKRSRSRKSDHEPHYPTPLFDARCGFKVVGRLIAHSDLNGSGVRLPVRGLSVTGPLAEAEQGIPPASLREVHSDDFVIGACLDRSGTIEFVPEGLEKLGLCEPRAGPLLQLHTHPAMQTVEPSKEEEEVVPQPLTAIGRAAVEVVWLGCTALTTFYGPQSQDQRT